MLPGVSQNVGCTTSSPIQLPTFPLSLDHSSLSQHYCAAELERGGMLDDMNRINMIQGRVAVWVCAHTVISHTSLYEARSSLHPHTYTQLCTYTDPLWWLWQPFVRSKRFLSKQNQSPPPSSAAESSGVCSLPASLFKLGLKRWADLHSTFTFGKKKLRENLVNLGEC